MRGTENESKIVKSKEARPLSDTAVTRFSLVTQTSVRLPSAASNNTLINLIVMLNDNNG